MAGTVTGRRAITKAAPQDDSGHRLDKWLWHTRLFKTRALATAAVNGGKIKVDGDRVKPARQVALGDQMSVSIGERTIDIEVLKLPSRRGPAPEAYACYKETLASAARSIQFRDQQRLAALTRPRPVSRPDKRERRQLDRLRRQQG
ncbi:MAG: RNA-binding S4 domain-containing protein [Steroidobacteraceae bacterium]